MIDRGDGSGAPSSVGDVGRSTGRNPNYRIKRDERFADSMEYLTQEVRLFPSYAVLMMFAAFAGHANDVFLPVERPLAGKGLHLSNFDSMPGGRELLDLFAFVHTKSQDALATDAGYEAFEGYANAGYPLLLQKLGIQEGERLSERRVGELVLKLYTFAYSPDGLKLY